MVYRCKFCIETDHKLYATAIISYNYGYAYIWSDYIRDVVHDHVTYIVRVMHWFVQVKADYRLMFAVQNYSNPTNSLSNGSCCDTSCLVSQCCTNDSCNLATRICFREADQPHTPQGECTRGEFTYPYLPDVVNSRSMIPVRGPLINVRLLIEPPNLKWS